METTGEEPRAVLLRTVVALLCERLDTGLQRHYRVTFARGDVVELAHRQRPWHHTNIHVEDTPSGRLNCMGWRFSLCEDGSVEKLVSFLGSWMRRDLAAVESEEKDRRTVFVNRPGADRGQR